MSTSVTSTDTRSDPRHPSRFEKKKNMVLLVVVVLTALGPAA
jgi:hypothetical protein